MDVINTFTPYFYLIRRAYAITLVVITTFISHSSFAALVTINEIHYDNTGSDTGEAIELVGLIDTDLTGWHIVLYNGGDNSPYRVVDLADATKTNAGQIAFWHIPISGIQNGANDGVALADNENNVLEFLSYEGTITAEQGVASGLTSIDINAQENASTPVGFSLQRAADIFIVSDGLQFSGDQWESASSTWGAANRSQQLVATTTVPVPGGIVLMATALSAMGLYRRQATQT